MSSRIKFDSTGYFDNTQIVNDVSLLRLTTQHVVSTFAGRRITKILTAASDGIPLATLIANALDVDLVVAPDQIPSIATGIIETAQNLGWLCSLGLFL